jgi:hypothetical protein
MFASQTTVLSANVKDDARLAGHDWTAVIERVFRAASRRLGRPSPHRFDLNEHLLADIGETPAAAEAARRASRSPLGAVGRYGSAWQHAPLSRVG